MIEDLRQLGAPDEVIQAEYDRFDRESDGANRDFVVWPENWPVIEVFCDCLRPLQVDGYIPTAEIESSMRLRRIRVAERLDLVSGVRLVEQGYLRKLPSAKPKGVPNRPHRHR